MIARREPSRRSPAADAEFRRSVDEAKQRVRLSDVVSRHTTLKQRGRGEMVGLCPFHEERSPSFEVNDAKGLYHCYGCGARGDSLTFLMRKDGLSFIDAARALASDLFPSVTPADRVRVAEEDEARRAAAIDDARTMWAACDPVEGTPAETYLRQARGLTLSIPACVRFGHVPTSRDDAGAWKRPYPAMVLACTDLAGEVVGLQRVFLSDDGRSKRWGKRSKFSLGRPRGSAVRIGDASPGADIILCEGPEDGLSLAQELPDAAIWVALGTDMMPALAFAEHQRAVTIAGQNDDPGRAAVDVAADALMAKGMSVRVMWPSAGFKDWNDELRGLRQ